MAAPRGAPSPQPGGGGQAQLGPADAQALLNGATPQALQVMKRMFDAIFDGIIAKKTAMAGGGGAQAGTPAPQAGAPAPGAQPSPGGTAAPAPTPAGAMAPAGVPRPQTRLSQMQ